MLINNKKYNLLDSKSVRFTHLIKALYPFRDLTQLTPKNFQNVLIKIKLIIQLTIQALEAFENRKLKNFDAHVGETACQIRACILLHIQQGSYQETSLKEDKKNLRSALELLLRQDKPKKWLYLNEFLNSLPFVNSFNSITGFLGACFILSQYTWLDEEHLPQGIEIQKFNLNFNQTRKFTEKLMHKLQLLVSNASTQFIFNLANSLGFSQENLEMIKTSILCGDEDRKTLPAYTSIYLINRYLLQTDFFISLRINHKNNIVCLLFRVINGKVIRSHTFPSDNPCFCVYGVSNSDLHSEALSKVLSQSMIKLDIIRYSFSVHSQYPGIKLQKQNQKINECPQSFFPGLILNYFESDLIVGKSLGCGKENIDIFLVKHVYASSLKGELLLSHKKDAFMIS